MHLYFCMNVCVYVCARVEMIQQRSYRRYKEPSDAVAIDDGGRGIMEVSKEERGIINQHWCENRICHHWLVVKYGDMVGTLRWLRMTERC
jgi:hypothetical protein